MSGAIKPEQPGASFAAVSVADPEAREVAGMAYRHAQCRL